MKRISVAFKLLTLVLITAVFSGAVYLSHILPDKFYIENGCNELNINCVFDLSGSVRKNSLSQKADLKLMGVFPIKTVNVENIERLTLIPCGTPFGIKMLTQGVIITDFGDVKDMNNVVHSSPGQTAGLAKGDIITKINNKEITSSKALTAQLELSSENTVEIEYIRGDKTSTMKVKTIRDKSGYNKLGLWVRDSAAGIGTMTFYDPTNDLFGGLGHGICDVDTGKLLPLQSGEIVPAVINNVIKSKSGAPGELCGTLIQETRTGKIYANTENGLFGNINTSAIEYKPLPIALKQEIECGEAYILSTINGDKPEKFTIQIKSISLNSSNNKNMIIEITDNRLLDLTGGIVQGMSGSPIIQNGRLVGAVTHVFVNEPAKGYGIFIENMIDEIKNA
ncbi:MAG: SpoIVB peptidase [Ruminiclostridium sp.]|nr:SpoIVB peptidase [Ruminiclostridium sp.]